MRTRTILHSFEDIKIFLQYLYLDENHYVIIDNGLTKLKIFMDDECNTRCINLSFPDFPPTLFPMTIADILGAIEYLQQLSPEMKHTKFTDHWDEIKTITLANTALNKEFICT